MHDTSFRGEGGRGGGGGGGGGGVDAMGRKVEGGGGRERVEVKGEGGCNGMVGKRRRRRWRKRRGRRKRERRREGKGGRGGGGRGRRRYRKPGFGLLVGEHKRLVQAIVWQLHGHLAEGWNGGEGVNVQRANIHAPDM